MLEQIKTRIEAATGLPCYYDERTMQNCTADGCKIDDYYIYIDEYRRGNYTNIRGLYRTDNMTMYVFKATDGRGAAEMRDGILDDIEREVIAPILRAFVGQVDGCTYEVTLPRYDIFEVGVELRINIKTEVCQ